MSIKAKIAGAYHDVAGVFVKRSGVYESVAGVFAKVGGAYTSVIGAGVVANPGVAFVGDSQIQYGHGWVGLSGCSMVRDAAGIVTVTKSSHGIYGSQPVNVVNCSNVSFEGMYRTTYLTANSFSYDSGVVGAAATITGLSNTGVSIQNRPIGRGIWLWLNAAFGGGLRFCGNFGQGGDQLVHMGPAVAAACATDADIVVLEGGINDIMLAAASGATVAARMQTHVDTVLAAGKHAHIIGITPLGFAGATNLNSLAITADTLSANIGYAAIAAANQGRVTFSDPYPELVDTVTTPPIAGAPNCWTWAVVDGVHWGRRAAQIISAGVKAEITSKITPAVILPASAADLPAAIGYQAIKQWTWWSGAGVTATGVGVSGTTADKVNVASSNAATTCVCSRVARTDGVDGYWLRQTITPGGANHTVTSSINDRATNVISMADVGLVVGDTIRFAVEIKMSGGIAGNSAGTYIEIASSTPSNGLASGGYFDTVQWAREDTVDGVLVSGDLLIESSFTTLFDYLRATIVQKVFSASATPIVLDIGRIVLFKKI